LVICRRLCSVTSSGIATKRGRTLCLRSTLVGVARGEQGQRVRTHCTVHMHLPHHHAPCTLPCSRHTRVATGLLVRPPKGRFGLAPNTGSIWNEVGGAQSLFSRLNTRKAAAAAAPRGTNSSVSTAHTVALVQEDEAINAPVKHILSLYATRGHWLWLQCSVLFERCRPGRAHTRTRPHTRTRTLAHVRPKHTHSRAPCSNRWPVPGTQRC
jgi:hypothetical protein